MLTIAEQTVDNCCQELEERLKPFISNKKTIKGEEQAVLSQSIMQVLVGEFMPKWTRMMFRLREGERDFVIEVYDSQGVQEMKPVTIRFKYEFEWRIESWKEALCIPTKEERKALLDYWESGGYMKIDIARHFNIDYNLINKWLKHDSRKMGGAKHHKTSYNTSSKSAVIARTLQILQSAGVNTKEIWVESFIAAYSSVTNCTFAPQLIKYVRGKKEVPQSPDIEKCKKIATIYIENLISKIKEINAQSETNTSFKSILRHFSTTTGIKTACKCVYFPKDQKIHSMVNHESLEKCIAVYTNVLENLNNNKRKELEVA